MDRIVRSNAAPNQLVFEISEAAALANVNAAMTFIRRPEGDGMPRRTG